MATYYELVEYIKRQGPYMGDVIGKCLRQHRAFSGSGPSRIDKFLLESKTFQAAKIQRNLKAEFISKRAVKGFLLWQESRKFNTKAFFPIEVDQDSGVIRQMDHELYGLLEDVRPCLHRRTTEGQYIPWKRDEAGDFSDPSQLEIDRHDPTKSKFGTTGRPGRIQQDGWRKRVAALWNNQCAVTGCQNSALLDGAHILPHREGTTEQRLDEQNGIYLVAHLHRAFDRGLISFSPEGMLLFSKRFDERDRKAVGIPPDATLKQMPARTKKYLAAHRTFYGFV